jgi:hypothetical protein
LADPRSLRKTQHYSVDEMRATLAALDKDSTAREHAVMVLSFDGLSRGEIGGLQWGGDLKKGTSERPALCVAG